MKNDKISNILVFSYISSVLLVNPILSSLIKYHDFSFFSILIIYMVSALLVNQILHSMNTKFNFVEKIIKNIFFQYWLFFSLKMENTIRKNMFLFGFFASLIIVILVITWIQGFSVKKPWLLILYYCIMIYIKIRTNLVNNEILEISHIDYLNWCDFIRFYKIQNSFIQDFKFKNITAFYGTNYITELNKKSNKVVKQGLQFCFGLIAGLISNYWYYNFVSKIDGLYGVRKKTLQEIDIIINAIQTTISNNKQLFCDQDKQNLNSLQPLLQDLIFFQALKQKIIDLPLIYFVLERNTDKIKEIGQIVVYYGGLNSLEIFKLKNFLKNINFFHDIVDNNTDKLV